ncbi:DUF4384 domain-containing protein [Candidatus Poribacteria bacterium]|nr:DUF4384 domain-containing protein [Candidatus Poribacteria bacterium]
MSKTSVARMLVLALGAALLPLAAGCSGLGLYRRGIKKAGLTPLQYPQSAMTVGAMGWGDPDGVTDAFRPGMNTLPDDLIKNLPTADAAWVGEGRSREVFLKAVAKPGPEILDSVRLLSAAAGVDLSREGMTFLDYGVLVERSMDFQRLSEAIVRGWYNMPGEAVRFDALSALRPDIPKYEQRPWIVQRSVSAHGLEYEVSASTGAALTAAALQPIYGAGSASAGIKMENETTLRIEKPMVIGFGTATLVSIEPPLPTVGRLPAPADLVPHVFTWKVRGRKKPVVISVDPSILRAIAKRSGFEESRGEEGLGPIVTAVHSAAPTGISVMAEARHRKEAKAEWRRLGEGSTFNASDMIRLRVGLSEPAYVYILAKDSAGKGEVLFPNIPGEKHSIGDESRIGAGEFIFPAAVNSRDGIIYGDGPRGTESFLVIASQERQPDMAASLATFAAAARARAAGQQAATRGLGLAFPDITRVPIGYEGTGGSAGQQGEPVFSGVDTATMITLNFTKVPLQ